MTRLRYDGLTTTLGGSLNSGATTVTFAGPLTHDVGTNVPTLVGADYIELSILDEDFELAEIVHLTAYTAGATTGAISRGQEGTAADFHPAGRRVVNAPTVQDFSASEITVVPGGSISSTNVQDALLELDSEKRAQVATTPTVVGTDSSYVNNSTSGSAPIPGAAVAGDWCFIFVGHFFDLSAIPSGWTRVGRVTAGANMRGSVLWKVLTGGDIAGSPVSLTFGSAGYGEVIVAAVSGARQISSFLNGQQGSNKLTFSPTLAGIDAADTSGTLVWNYSPGVNDLVFAFGAGRNPGQSITCDIGSNLVSRNDANANAALASAVATGPVAATFTCTNITAWYGAVLSLAS